TRAHRFADTYRHGLDAAQAAWAARNFKRHRVLPHDFFYKTWKQLQLGGEGIQILVCSLQIEKLELVLHICTKILAKNQGCTQVIYTQIYGDRFLTTY
ncbi:hypothetical protein B0H19DRAFT_970632, partial [Mycena capillaripes]